jgi:hypothetical protein
MQPHTNKTYDEMSVDKEINPTNAQDILKMMRYSRRNEKQRLANYVGQSRVHKDKRMLLEPISGSEGQAFSHKQKVHDLHENNLPNINVEPSRATEILRYAKCLGFKEPPFRKYLQDIPDEILMHQGNDYWVCNYLNLNNSSWLDSDKTESYEKLGFNTETARNLVISPLFAKHQDALYFALTYVDNVTESQSLHIELKKAHDENTTSKRISFGGKEIDCFIFGQQSTR